MAKGRGIIVGGLALVFALPPNAILSQETHHVKAGETLANIAELYYGDRYFDVIIELYNEIPDLNRIAVDRELVVPSIDSILSREGIDSVSFPAADAIKRVWHEHHRRSGSLSRLVWMSNPADSEWYTPFPDSLRTVFLVQAELLEQAAESLGVARGGVIAVPRRTMAALRSCAAELREMAHTGCDREGYCVTVVYQRIASALRNAILWARAGFK